MCAFNSYVSNHIDNVLYAHDISFSLSFFSIYFATSELVDRSDSPAILIKQSLLRMITVQCKQSLLRMITVQCKTKRILFSIFFDYILTDKRNATNKIKVVLFKQ